MKMKKPTAGPFSPGNSDGSEVHRNLAHYGMDCLLIEFLWEIYEEDVQLFQKLLDDQNSPNYLTEGWHKNSYAQLVLSLMNNTNTDLKKAVIQSFGYLYPKGDIEIKFYIRMGGAIHRYKVAR